MSVDSSLLSHGGLTNDIWSFLVLANMRMREVPVRKHQGSWPESRNRTNACNLGLRQAMPLRSQQCRSNYRARLVRDRHRDSSTTSQPPSSDLELPDQWFSHIASTDFASSQLALTTHLRQAVPAIFRNRPVLLERRDRNDPVPEYRRATGAIILSRSDRDGYRASATIVSASALEQRKHPAPTKRWKG